MNEYKRVKPHRFNKDRSHTCYEGHDCEEKWTVEHHLAEALELLNDRSNLSNYKNDECWYDDHKKKIEHHIRMAWQKSK